MSRRRQALKAFYAAMFSGLGSGLVMIVAGALFGAWRGAYPYMALLSAAGLAAA
jgi:hypothetical protein